MTPQEIRKAIKKEFPSLSMFSVKAVSFEGFGYGSAYFVSVATTDMATQQRLDKFLRTLPGRVILA